MQFINIHKMSDFFVKRMKSYKAFTNNSQANNLTRLSSNLGFFLLFANETESSVIFFVVLGEKEISVEPIIVIINWSISFFRSFIRFEFGPVNLSSLNFNGNMGTLRLASISK